MSNNLDAYKEVFRTSFGVDDAALNDQLVYQSVPAWDSVGHMGMIAALEEAFNIVIETDDIVDFSSYAKGMDIVRKYGVQL